MFGTDFIKFGGSIAVTIILCLLLIFVISNLRGRRRKASESGSLDNLRDTLTSENRIDDRAELRWDALIEFNGQKLNAATKNISTTGAFIVCSEPLGVKSVFRLTAFIPKAPPLTLQAEVIWNNTNVPQDEVQARGMGVRFLQLSENDRQLLKEAIAAGQL